MASDRQIYERFPEISKLNDECVELKRSLPGLRSQIAEANAAVVDAVKAGREQIDAATELVDAAQRQLTQVQAKAKAHLGRLQAVVDELQSQERIATQRMREVQERHNRLLDDANAEITAEEAAKDVEAITAEDVGEVPAEILKPE